MGSTGAGPITPALNILGSAIGYTIRSIKASLYFRV